jgi:hypothetical protein
MIKLGKYRHYKGHMCNVIGVAKHSENPEEELVVYSHPDKKGVDQLWARPKSMFVSDVEVEGKTMKRFEYVGE